MSDHLTPIEVAERLIGPKPELERLAGYQPKAAYAWERSSQSRPAGYLPVRVQLALLAHARAHALPIDPAWLIEGAPIEAVHAALDQMRGRAA